MAISGEGEEAEMPETGTLEALTRVAAVPPRAAKTIPEIVQQQIKSAVHKELIKRMDLGRLGEFQETRGGPGSEPALQAGLTQPHDSGCGRIQRRNKV